MHKLAFIFITSCSHASPYEIDRQHCIAACIDEIHTDDVEAHCDDAMTDRPCCQWGADVMPCDVVERIQTSPK